MQLDQIANRQPPTPWRGTAKIPWGDRAFSTRMLREHLNQQHSRASRPQSTIERQVDLLHETVLNGSAGNVLDLGCGPGLYCASLTARGHVCTGIDIAPAAIDYARSQDDKTDYRLGDVRAVDIGNGFDLVMMTFGEFNAFSPQDGLALIHKMRDAAWPGGAVVLEVHAEQAIRDIGNAPPTWRALPSSVFSDEPHLWLSENFWHEEELAAVSRHFVVDEAGGSTEYVNTLQGYRQHDYVTLLQHNGFRRIRLADSLTEDPGFFFLIAGT